MNALARRLLDKERIFDVNEMTQELEDAIAPEGPMKITAEAANRDPLLIARERTHGSFKDNATVSQGMKSTFRMMPGWTRLHDVEREALDMIALKIGRILSGKSLEPQHWEDVVGYAKLALEQAQLGDL